jgi:SAM-dependent methyltransferase
MPTKILKDIIVCSSYHSTVRHFNRTLCCTFESCSIAPRHWPIAKGFPIVQDETKSYFRIVDVTARTGGIPLTVKKRTLLGIPQAYSPSLSRNVVTKRNMQRQIMLVKKASERPLSLVTGCGDWTSATGEVLASPAVTAVNTDVRWSKIVDVLCDGHQLPVAHNRFDAVIVQGVLEHDLSSTKIVDEIERVLKPAGLAYCDDPFRQPTYGGPFDFTRLTFAGHRKLWARFEEVDVGAWCGPGVALAYSIQQFARALMPSRVLRAAGGMMTNWTLWWLKYLDEILAKRLAGLDGASAYFFLGQRGGEAIDDQRAIASYRGAQQ